jgi:Lar family restriction alleviation protein
MPSPELKPCPFCGGKAVCIDRTIPDKTKPRFSILCESCRAATCWIDTEENAIAAWNRRVKEGGQP